MVKLDSKAEAKVGDRIVSGEGWASQYDESLRKDKDMNVKTEMRRVVGVRRRVYLIALFAIIFTVVALNAHAEGRTQCSAPQKESKAMKLAALSTLSTSVTRDDLPLIDLILPAKTEIAIFAMG